MPPKVVLALTSPFRDTSNAKVSSCYTLKSEVIVAHLFHLKPIFAPSLKKVVRGAAVLGGECASKTWLFSSAYKFWGRSTP